MMRFINTSNDSGYNLGDISSDFESLRISALTKASKISGLIDGVTIGPDSVDKNKSWRENSENEQNNCNLNITKKSAEFPVIQHNESSRGGLTFSKKKIFLENEKSRLEEVRKAINERKQRMVRSQEELQRDLALASAAYASARERAEAAEWARLKAEEEILDLQNEIKRRHEQQLLAHRFQEREERRQREEREYGMLEERKAIIQKIRDNFRERWKHVGMQSKTCKDKIAVSQMLGPFAMKLKELHQQMELINEKARKGELSAIDVQFAEQLAQQGDDVLNDCESEIARIDMAFEEEIARREHEVQLAEANAQIANANMQASVLQGNSVPGQMQQMNQSGLEVIQPIGRMPETPPNEIASNVIETGATTTDSSSVETVIDEYDQEAYQIYQKAKDLLAQHTASPAFIEFKKATVVKKFRFECQKAINQPLNTIAVVNGSHLLEKYNKLHKLLSGQSSLNVYQHPQGPVYCKNLLAEKIVNQGETLVSSKPESAFGIAAVTIALMSDFPDFAELLKSHFYITCPYLVPFFPPKLQGQTDENYYVTLGYKYTDEGVEKETKFLTRMSGIMRLYAAIIVANRRRNSTGAHPLGLQNAWRWLAATINYEVQPKFADICATLILDMLEVVGNALWIAYPRQCPKLLLLLQQHYYPQIQNCGGVGGGPAMRLGKFLNDCITQNFIPPPNGQLPPNFW